MTEFVGFTDERSKTYDERVRQHIPGYEILHGLSETLLASELPEKASLLVVGTGTGMEMLAWAPRHPDWSFLGTDPSQAMLGLAEQKITAAGLSDRVRLQVGSAPASAEETFDAAVALLVLHFVSDEEKLEMLSGMADHLKPGAPILVASLFGDTQATRFKRLTSARKAWSIARGLDPQMAEQFCDPNRSDMHIVPEERLKILLRDAGFIDIQRVYQALTIGLWFARLPR